MDQISFQMSRTKSSVVIYMKQNLRNVLLNIIISKGIFSFCFCTSKRFWKHNPSHQTFEICLACTCSRMTSHVWKDFHWAENFPRVYTLAPSSLVMPSESSHGWAGTEPVNTATKPPGYQNSTKQVDHQLQEAHRSLANSVGKRKFKPQFQNHRKVEK